METATGTGNVALDPAGLIAADVVCVRCGYNLRGLDPNRQCPECGTAIGRSLQGDFLRFRDPDWVESLASGMNWIVWGILCSILVAVGSTVLMATTGAGGGGPLHTVIWTAVGIISFIGYWKVTIPEPANQEKPGEWNARRVARFGVIVQLASGPVIEGLMRLLAGVPVLPTLLAIGLWITNMVGYFAFMIYARRIALRMPNEKLAKHTRIVMWGMIIPLVNVICGIWALLLIDRYRKGLREAAQQARETWAAGAAADLTAG